MTATGETRHRVALANADYEQRKAKNGEHSGPTMRKVEREWKLKAGSLKSYRANRGRRKDAGVEKLFGNKLPCSR